MNLPILIGSHPPWVGWWRWWSTAEIVSNPLLWAWKDPKEDPPLKVFVMGDTPSPCPISSSSSSSCSWITLNWDLNPGSDLAKLLLMSSLVVRRISTWITTIPNWREGRNSSEQARTLPRIRIFLVNAPNSQSTSTNLTVWLFTHGHSRALPHARRAVEVKKRIYQGC